MKDRNAPQSALDGTVIGGNMQRRRHQEFIRFPNGWGTRSPRSSGATAICAKQTAGADVEPTQMRGVSAPSSRL
jgi:hypothetical protein